ncbi:MAG: hypothetical protein M1286_00115 [Candidatus Marsarchaeota archaeon]|nr:hypothetical protein [Candidatus Marsarchaeota archaeon]
MNNIQRIYKRSLAERGHAPAVVLAASLATTLMVAASLFGLADGWPWIAAVSIVGGLIYWRLCFPYEKIEGTAKLSTLLFLNLFILVAVFIVL